MVQPIDVGKDMLDDELRRFPLIDSWHGFVDGPSLIGRLHGGIHAPDYRPNMPRVTVPHTQ